MGIIELPNNDYVLNKIAHENDWSFRIAVGANSYVSCTLDLEHFSVSDDKILIPVRTNGYVVESTQ